MDNHIHNTTPNPGYRIRPGIDFEDYFNKDAISLEKIEFSRHYIETKMGYDLNEDALIDFSAIGIKLFGCMVVDIVLEYETYKDRSLDG